MRIMTTIAALSVAFLAACTTPEPVKTANAAPAQDNAPVKKAVVSGSRIPQDASIKQVGVTQGTYNPMPH